MRPRGIIPVTAALFYCFGLAAGEEAGQTWSVDQGTTAILIEDHRAPLVTLVLDFPGGHWSPWVIDKRAEPAFTMQFTDSKRLLRRRADEKALSVSLQIGEVSSSLQMECARADLPEALALVRDLLANRDLDRREMRRRAQERRLGWQGAQKSPQGRMKRAAAEWLFQPGDPRLRGVEKPRPLSSDPKQLAAWRDAWIRFPGRVIGFAGDLTRAEAEQAAAGLLPEPASRAEKDLEPKWFPVKAAGQRSSRVVVKMKRLTQVFFGMVRPSLTYDDPRRPAFLIADHVLGGNFYSRLSVALRHQGGETYGAGTMGRGGRAEEPYALWSYTNAANADVGRRKLRQVLKEFHDQGITEEERAAAAGFLLGRRAFTRQSPKQILWQRIETFRLGQDPAFFDRLAEQAAALPLEQINAFIREFYRPEDFTPIEAIPAKPVSGKKHRGRE